MTPLEGKVIGDRDVEVLKQRFANIDPACQATIREIADETFGAISMNPPTARRVGIARILLEIAEQERHIDKDLVRSICTLRTGKQYKNAGLALADLSWVDAERVWSTFQDIYAGRVELQYIPVSNQFTTKEIRNVR
jgi:hypothetical protein